MDEANILKSANDDNVLSTSLEDSWSDLEISPSEEVSWKQPETKPTGVVPKADKTKSIILRPRKINEVNCWGPTVSLPSYYDAVWTKKEISKKGSIVDRSILRTGPLSPNESWSPASSSQTRIAPVKHIPRTKPHQLRNHKRYSIMSHKNIIIANKTARNTKELEEIIRKNKKVLESERREKRKRKKKSEEKMLNLRDPKVRGVVKDLLQRILSRKLERKRAELLSIENESYELKRNLNKALLGHNMSTKFKKDPIILNFRKIDSSDFTESSHENLERDFKRKLRLSLQKSN